MRGRRGEEEEEAGKEKDTQETEEKRVYRYRYIFADTVGCVRLFIYFRWGVTGKREGYKPRAKGKTATI